eukprot:SAG31_NODE_600_length_13647_cov_3.894376_1_plen_55_part_10
MKKHDRTFSQVFILGGAIFDLLKRYDAFEPVGHNLANDRELWEQRKNSKALAFDR